MFCAVRKNCSFFICILPCNVTEAFLIIFSQVIAGDINTAIIPSNYGGNGTIYTR